MSVLAIVFPPPLTVAVVIGVELAIVGAALFALRPRIERRFPRIVGVVPLLSTVALIGGIGLVASVAIGDTTPDTNLPNPVPATVRSVTVGADLYQATCAACHGVDGRGGGPQAGTTPIRPADLRSGHLTTHTDGDIYYWISSGLPGGMPAWSATLSETDRWNLVNYLRSINGEAPSPAPSPSASATPPAGQGTVGLLLAPIALLGALGWLASGLRRRLGR